MFNPHAEVPTIFGLSLDSQQHTLSIGRSSECNFKINAPSVSEHHAELSFEQGGWVLKDHDSTNGIRADRALKTEVNLKHGSSVLLGQVEMVFREISWAF